MDARPKSSKSSVRRRPSARSMAAASSPLPDAMSAFNGCGHDGCNSGGCNVRYVGPVSHLRDHHALHAARGVTHVWTAAIVSGLAVVLTGVLAYNAAQAAANSGTRRMSPDLRAVMDRLDRLETSMQAVSQHCLAVGAEPEQAGEQTESERTATGTDTTERHGP